MRLQRHRALLTSLLASSLTVTGSAGGGTLRGAAAEATDVLFHHDVLEPLSICFLASIDEDIHYDEEGRAISVIPVKREQFANGIFLQDSMHLDKCSFQPLVDVSEPSTCFEHTVNSDDRVVCELCRFPGFTHFPSTNSTDLDLVPCRSDVVDIAQKCLNGTCIDVAPNPDKFLNVEKSVSSSSNRNLIFADDVLGDDPSKWMESLHSNGLMNTAKLNDLVLPGSHNSAAVALEAEKHCEKINLQVDSLADEVAKNQDIDLAEQLNQGIRFLDLRVIENTKFYGLQYPLHHAFLIHEGHTQTLYQAFDVLEDFLTRNPMETIVVRIDGYDGCREAGKDHKTLWKAEISRRPQLRLIVQEDLTGQMSFLTGKALIDVERKIINEDWPGKGFGSDALSDDKGPFEYGKYYKHNDGLEDRFSVWPFFPNIDETDAIQTLVNPLFQGLEDWDKPYMNHIWMMHSLVGLRARNVNAIITDRVGQTGIYDVATRLSLYRLFDKKPLPSKWDAIVTKDYVNALTEEFEYHCPEHYIMQGLSSYHDNREEDRRWKYVCRRVEWVEREPFCGGSTGWQKRQYHPSAFKSSYAYLLRSINSLDADVRFHWEGGDFAITGFGGKYSQRQHDRAFYFYAAKVTKTKTECTWTGFVNELDGALDYQTKPDEWISGVISQHSNWNEDRRWKFYVCR